MEIGGRTLKSKVQKSTPQKHLDALVMNAYPARMAEAKEDDVGGTI